jgi:hypothetical protein
VHMLGVPRVGSPRPHLGDKVKTLEDEDEDEEQHSIRSSFKFWRHQRNGPACRGTSLALSASALRDIDLASPPPSNLDINIEHN